MNIYPLAAILVLPGLTSAQHTLFTFPGTSAGDRLGKVASAGDVDRDGTPDIIIAAPHASPNGASSGAVRVLSGRDGRVLYSLSGSTAGDEFGFSVDGVGDLNRDGFTDFAVGVPGADNGSVLNVGKLVAYSGKDGTVLFTLFGDSKGDSLGSAVSGCDDVNKDGHPDVVVGAILDDDGSAKIDCGSATVFSGKDGKVIHKWYGISMKDYFGCSAAGIGDVNGDGYSDVIVGAYFGSYFASGRNGIARVFDGRTGKPIHTHEGRSAGDWFGAAVASVGDLDQDGVRDILIGASRDDDNGTDSGSVRAVSGKTAKTLFTVYGNKAGDYFSKVAGVGDLNGDGTSDFAVGSFGADTNGTDSGSIRVYSGKDRKVLLTLHGDRAGDRFGGGLAGLGDVNGDGVPDLVVGAHEADANGADSGLARVISGTRLTLWTDRHLLKLRQAGSQWLLIDLGRTHAGRLYWIFGSATGTTPGITFGGVHLPLNPDPYSDVLIGATNTALFQGFWGTLSNEGKATASINVPAFHPAVSNLTLYHAALIYDAKNIYAATNATTIRLEN